MTWPIAVFACFSVLVFSIVGFLLFIYVKEYSREQKTFNEFIKFKDQIPTSPLLYVLDKPAKKSKAPPPPPKLDKNKKNIN
jgi:hypothetical protein